MSGFSPEFPGAEVRLSPNFGPRQAGYRPDMIILHYTGMETGEAAASWLCDPASQVSSHYLVHEDGRVVQMVREQDRAWHAGKSSWRGVSDINSCSIGIEIVNPGHALGYVDFPNPQMGSVIALCADIVGRHGIAPERLLGHSDVAPGRKVDPGERFDWQRLARAGLGHFVAPAVIEAGSILRIGDHGDEVQALQSMLSVYGYDIEISAVYDQRTSVVVAAFQRHFRPRLVDGMADRSTLNTLAGLIESLPTCFD